MLRDPFYQDITDRLGRQLDPELFERCAVALLRKVYPGLVPVRGGADAGMDGAVATRSGSPIPLITTTGKEATRNLRKNLLSYLENGGERRTAIFATSRELTARKRKNLEKEAKQHGFRLHQIHDQADFADRLYHAPEWCRELLNLTGHPPPLCMVPPTDRPLGGVPLVGRDRDLEWLRSQTQDVLIVGQPGCGKTALHHALSRDGEHLFVVSKDMREISGALRRQQPSAVIVDDAHLQTDLLRELRHFRDETGMQFRIDANCWPGAAEEVARALAVPVASARNLDLLTRDEMVRVIEGCGIVGPPELMHELLNQAHGRPGLAATLCHLCISGHGESVVLGDVIAQDVRTTFGRLLEPRAITLLAALAIGGRRGMSLRAASAELEISLLDAHTLASGLAAGGLLEDLGESCLAVLPTALRHVLVRDVFLNGSVRLSLDQFLQHATDAREAAHTIVGARARGGRVDDTFVLQLVERAKAWAALEEFAWLGPRECRTALDHFPTELPRLARASLHRIPDSSLPLLFGADVTDDRPPHQAVDRPLRIIEDWIESAVPGTGEVVSRRRSLLAAATRWAAATGHRRTAIQAAALALSPKFRDTQPKPGSGRAFAIRQGSITKEEAVKLVDLWGDVLALMRPAPADGWDAVSSAVETWAFPGRIATTVHEGVGEILRDASRRALVDMGPLAGRHGGRLRWCRELAGKLDLDLGAAADPEFDTLFPIEDFDRDWKTRTEAWSAASAALAARWAEQEPAAVAGRLKEMENSAEESGINFPDCRGMVSTALAARVESPLTWATAFAGKHCSGTATYPLLKKACDKSEEGWAALATTCLGDGKLRITGLDVILPADPVPSGLLADALRVVADVPAWVTTCCAQGRFSVPVTKMLLEHGHDDVASAAAIGAWIGANRREVRDELKIAWRSATLRTVFDQHIAEILKDDADLSFWWLKARLTADLPDAWRAEEALKAAASSLGSEERAILIDELVPDHGAIFALVPALVGDDPELYRRLLGRTELKLHHPYPLAGRIDDAWVRKATVALDHGFGEEEVAHAVHLFGVSWTGSESSMWQDWVEQFERLATNRDDRIRRVGSVGATAARARAETAAQRERRQDIHGI